jgi:hypothetical protein
LNQTIYKYYIIFTHTLRLPDYCCTDPSLLSHLVSHSGSLFTSLAMAEASLWHRLNPFHHRPASGGPPTPLYKHRVIDAGDRTSFVDTSAPIPHDGDLRASAGEFSFMTL